MAGIDESQATFLTDILTGLTDSVNRGAVAGTIGAPVDVISLLLNAGLGIAGVRPIDKPVGGSEWIGQKMQDAGMVSGKRNSVAEFLSGIVGTPMMSKAAATIGPILEDAAVQIAANASKTSPANIAARGQLGATLFHGSPYNFDKFSSSKLLSGEGANSFASGTYLAESKVVGKTYRDQVSQSYNARQIFELESELNTLQYKLNAPQRRDAPGLSTKERSEIYAKQAELRNSISEAKKNFNPTLYTVQVPDSAINKMVDYDKPLGQQSAKVQEVLKGLGFTESKEPIGPELVKRGVEKALLANDIPGLKYFDAGSRSNKAGTRNYVLFPGAENLISILSKE